MSNLTTLAAVKEYLGITVSVQDTLINTLIPRAGDQVEKYCSRSFPMKAYTDKLISGSGTSRLTLPANPVLSVSSVQVGSVALTEAADPLTGTGFAFDEYSIYFAGGVSKFPMGINNVKASWVAGYQSAETAYVPSTGNTRTLTPSTDGNAATNLSVVYTANGLALTQVGNGPAVGQYSFTAPSYTFNATDGNAQVTMNYYYVPSSVEQAVIELVGLKLKQRTNIGVRSQGIAGESVSYEDRDMTPSIKQMLRPYMLRVYS